VKKTFMGRSKKKKKRKKGEHGAEWGKIPAQSRIVRDEWLRPTPAGGWVSGEKAPGKEVEAPCKTEPGCVPQTLFGFKKRCQRDGRGDQWEPERSKRQERKKTTGGEKRPNMVDLYQQGEKK